MPLRARPCVEAFMKLPSHVLTKLFVASAATTVGVVVMLQPMRPKPQCTPCEEVVEAVPVEVETESLLEIVREQNYEPNVVPIVVPLPAQTPQPQPIVKPKPKPPRHFASSCGGLVPIDPSQGEVKLKACGKG